MKPLSTRLLRRLLFHHAVLALASAALIVAIYVLIRSDQIMFRLSMATAYVGLLLIVVTLLIGPIRVLRKRPPPVGSNDLRRDIGIWAALVSFVHVIVGLQVHLGSMVLYFLHHAGPDKRLVPRVDPFGLANYLGLAATVVIALLLALSNDWSVRRLGPRKWKRLQRSNYAGFALIVLHGVVYQIIEKRTPPYPVVFGAMVLLVIAIQLAAFRQRKLLAA